MATLKSISPLNLSLIGPLTTEIYYPTRLAGQTDAQIDRQTHTHTHTHIHSQTESDTLLYGVEYEYFPHQQTDRGASNLASKLM